MNIARLVNSESYCFRKGKDGRRKNGRGPKSATASHIFQRLFATVLTRCISFSCLAIRALLNCFLPRTIGMMKNTAGIRTSKDISSPNRSSRKTSQNTYHPDVLTNITVASSRRSYLSYHLALVGRQSVSNKGQEVETNNSLTAGSFSRTRAQMPIPVPIGTERQRQLETTMQKTRRRR